jgi:hypothetical protein
MDRIEGIVTKDGKRRLVGLFAYEFQARRFVQDNALSLKNPYIADCGNYYKVYENV